MAVLFGAWLVISFCFVVFSFGLTDPNLVLSSWQPYWQFQQWSWKTFFLNREVLVATYVLLLVALFSFKFKVFIVFCCVFFVGASSTT